MGVGKVCVNRQCEQAGVVQPYSAFYVRSGQANPTEAGHYTSECRACYKRRSRAVVERRLSATEPRAVSEVMAISYLHRHGIVALPGKAYLASDVDVVAWGCVRVEVKYSTLREGYTEGYKFSLTPRQKERGLLADVVLLICDDGEVPTFHLFRPEDTVFYFLDGRRKGGLLFVPGRLEQRKHQQNRVSMTQPMMDAAKDKLELIEAARLRIAASLQREAG